MYAILVLKKDRNLDLYMAELVDHANNTKEEYMCSISMVARYNVYMSCIIITIYFIKLIHILIRILTRITKQKYI